MTQASKDHADVETEQNGSEFEPIFNKLHREGRVASKLYFTEARDLEDSLTDHSDDCSTSPDGRNDAKYTGSDKPVELIEQDTQQKPEQASPEESDTESNDSEDDSGVSDDTDDIDGNSKEETRSSTNTDDNEGKLSENEGDSEQTFSSFSSTESVDSVYAEEEVYYIDPGCNSSGDDVGPIPIRYDTSSSSSSTSSSNDSDSSSESEARVPSPESPILSNSDCDQSPTELSKVSSLTDVSSLINNINDVSHNGISLLESDNIQLRDPDSVSSSHCHFRSLSDQTDLLAQLPRFSETEFEQELEYLGSCENKTSTPDCRDGGNRSGPKLRHLLEMNRTKMPPLSWLQKESPLLSSPTCRFRHDASSLCRTLPFQAKGYAQTPIRPNTMVTTSCQALPVSDLTPWRNNGFASEDEEAVHYLITKYLNNKDMKW